MLFFGNFLDWLNCLILLRGGLIFSQEQNSICHYNTFAFLPLVLAFVSASSVLFFISNYMLFFLKQKKKTNFKDALCYYGKKL